MKKEAMRAASVVFVFTLGCGAEVRKPIDSNWIEYPDARRGDQVDVYHGVGVPDPYRWMEDEASEESRSWLAAEATREYVTRRRVRPAVLQHLDSSLAPD